MARFILNNIDDAKKEETANNSEINLSAVIDEYYEANKIKKEKDNIVKANGNIIKEQLALKGVTEFNSGKHKASLSISDSIEYDEIKLLKLAKELPDEISSQIIEKIEIVNLEKLERLVIEGKLDTKKFKDAEVTKTTTKLYVK